MTHPASQRLLDLLEGLKGLHVRKQADYGSEVDPFANYRSAEDWGVPAWVSAISRADEKFNRLKTYRRTGRLANEGVEDAFRDAALGCVIAWVLWEQEHQEPPQG